MKKIYSGELKRGFIWLPVLFLMIFSWGCRQEVAEEQEGIRTIAVLKSHFADPPAEYRSAPLWDWNEQITEEGIDFQMKEFKRAGIGGVFVHPRPGLLTEYLSDEWFHLFDYTVQKGRELDMKVWIYDENSYPSGFAGGHVPAEMPDSYRNGAGLSMEVQQRLDVVPSDTVAVVLKEADGQYTDVTGTLDQEMGKEGTWYIFRKTYPGKSYWYGGFSYVDLLYPGVTEKFIEVTMTEGYEKNRADFGETLPGVFTDEPNLEAALSGGAIMRWTPDLWEVFSNRWGYDLRLHLPSLVEETGKWRKVRHDFYELLLELFVDRWAKPWSKYCEENNLRYTGHYWEHGWPVPTDGLDEAAFYIWHQQPGVDMLGNQLVEKGMGGQFGNDRAIRELLSAANQAGRTRTLSETYGGGGWEMSFEEQKRLADWQGVLGVNFVNQHLSYYSLNGVRKFDYPPSFSYHEPWWKHYRLMGDYIGRMSMAMSSGAQINHTLVLQPNTSAWMYFSRKESNPAIFRIRDGFKHFVYQLEQHHYEYDLGSENVLNVLGEVEGKNLRVGERDYDLVVIPAEMENMDQPTYQLLKEYLENGGRILSFNPDVTYVDGEVSALVNELAANYPDQWRLVDSPDDPEAAEWLLRKKFSMKDLTRNGMLYHQRRILDDGQLIFLVNSHPEEKATAEITLEGKYVSKLDLVSGKVYSFPAETSGGKVTLDVTLEPAGSALFAITGKKSGEPEYTPVSIPGEVVESLDNISVERESDNIMMINYLDLKTSASEKSGVYFMDALNGLFREKGVEMGNPWQHKIQYKQNYLALDSLFRGDDGFTASYHFFIDGSLDQQAMESIRAVVERPELWEVRINGHVVEKIPDQFWIDKDFPVYPVGQFLTKGGNTLTIEAPRMHILAEVMPVYLLGDFLVTPGDKGFQLAGGEINDLGSWQELGLPFYSQSVIYSQTFDIPEEKDASYKVQLTDWNAPVCEVLVNGRSAGLIAWKPWETDVTGLLKAGENKVAVRAYGSLKNTFGFFYQDNNSWIFGPFSWNQAPEEIPAASEYYLMDYGLFEPFKLVRIP